ncbi:MAG TPA: hypothetical protein VGX28_08890 [Frankiaceae bacterium]|jgi:hypothetical protein|nr:hypothetical protein [Frankiaceae bacterium]
MRKALAAAAAALTLVTSGCSLFGDDDPKFTSVAAPQVSLRAAGLKTAVRIGLLVSATSPAGEGADYLGPAAGARVAQYRFTQGGAEVTLAVRDDKGTAAAATAGVHALLGEGVVGIVAATSGRHLDDALRLAAGAGVPVLLPYEHRDVPGATTAWYTAPSAPQIRARLRTLLAAQGLQRPYVLHADGAAAAVTGLTSADHTTAVRPRQRAADAIAPVVAAAATKRIDSVVVAGSAATQAALVAELQGRAGRLPVVLSPQALTPAFGNALAARLDADGSATPHGRFLTVGRPSVDASAHGQGPLADAMSAFLAATRLAAQVDSVEALTHAVPFRQEGAATADAAAHDAVVALVRAAERADSTDAAAVAEALGSLTLGPADGLAGPTLGFAVRRPLADDALVAMGSTTQDPGLRSGVTEKAPAVTWFVLPTGD